eukprot:SAG31_NODE_9276_length_1306_cov_0.806959_1_plen_66_part_10
MNNEFFYDKHTQTLYYYAAHAPAADAVVAATKYKTFVAMQGTQTNPVKDIAILGVNFKDTALTYLD